MAELSSMPHFIKVCGVTSLEDARCVIAAGADAMGLILTASPRRLSVGAASDLASQTRGSILRVGVFRDNTTEFVCDAADRTGIDVAQIHGVLRDELVGELRDRGVSIIKALGVGTEEFMNFDESRVDAILVDGPSPGSGANHSWDELLERSFRRPFIAAGGLKPDNVVDTLAITGAWGVDVATGVESAPGRKDALRVRDFVANALAYYELRKESSD